MGKGVRRVVTGHDDSGKAVIIRDEEAPNVFLPPGRPGVQINNVWLASESPAKVSGNADTAPQGKSISLEPGPNGAVFRVIEYPPEKDWIDSVDRATALESFREFGAAHAADSSETPPHPLMHRTKTIDYAVCMSGEIWMVMDDSEVLIKAGDVVVQRGTNHAWSNRTDEPCRMAFVLIDGTYD